MPRTKGALDANHEETRKNLLNKVRARMTNTGAERLSFRELAAAAGVSVPTLRHYFGTRADLVAAVLRQIHELGKLHIEAVSRPTLNFEASLVEVASMLADGVRYGGMDRVHTLGLTEGLGDSRSGPEYLSSILEPALQAVEARLIAHQQHGEMIEVPPRHAALILVAPLLLAFLHQNRLGGAQVRPMEIKDFIGEQVRMFLKAYGTN